MTRRDDEFAEYAAARMPALRRLAVLLCQDGHRADDLVQAAITKLYVHWPKARAAKDINAYVRSIVIREFLRERRTSWARRLTLSGQLPERPSAGHDSDAAMDMQAALAGLPPRQHATLVLRFYCDLSVEQAALALGCSSGTVKSQTAKALASMRHSLGADTARESAGSRLAMPSDDSFGGTA
jgi:RNA polymerase sigma-70 factor (sigma-E family)